MAQKRCWVFILTNKRNTALYTGVTNNLSRRIFEHKTGLLDGFTKKYKAEKLVYFEEFNNAYDAIAREKQIKGWLRIKKIKLIITSNPSFDDLSDSIL